METHEYRALIEHVMTPRRPHLERVLATLRDCVAEAALRGDPEREGRLQVKELWFSLAAREQIPGDWVARPARTFRASRKIHTPRHLWDAVALASDFEGVTTAEQLAHEVQHRLAGWDRAPLTDVYWQVFSQGAQRDGSVRMGVYPLQGFYLTAWQAAERAVCVKHKLTANREAQKLARELGALRPDRQRSAVQACIADCVAAWWWQLACELGLLVPPRSRTGYYPYEVPGAMVGQAFADLPNPFDPLLALWQTGYALGGLSARLPGRIVLVAPALELDPALDRDGALAAWLH